MSKKYMYLILIIVIILIMVGLYAYPITGSKHQKSSFDEGIKVIMSSEKQTYKEGEPFVVDIRVKNLKFRAIKVHKDIVCPSSSLFLEFYEDIKSYYDIQVIDSKGRPIGNCVPQPENYYYYFIPGQTMYEKILFTPKKNIKLPSKTFRMNLFGTFHSAVVLYPISISSINDESK